MNLSPEKKRPVFFTLDNVFMRILLDAQAERERRIEERLALMTETTARLSRTWAKKYSEPKKAMPQL
jgi:hypothetical protein